MGQIAALFASDATRTAGIWLLVLMVGAFFVREWRETRKLSSDDRQARREGYAKQVAELHKENRALRSDLRRVEKDHDDYRKLCIEENGQLRGLIRSLEDHVVGLERQLAAAGLAVIRNLRPGMVSPHIAGAAERAARHQSEDGNDERDEPER